MIRVLLNSLVVLFAFWMATNVVIPASGPAASPSSTTVVWRRTDTGWIRAESWLAPQEHLYREPRPPIYPLSTLPLVVLISISALILFPSKTP